MHCCYAASPARRHPCSCLSRCGRCLLQDYDRQVSPEEGAELARTHNCLYYETSACTAEGVHEQFLLGLVSTLLGTPQLQQHAQQRAGHNAQAVAVSQQPKEQQASGGCCSY